MGFLDDLKKGLGFDDDNDAVTEAQKQALMDNLQLEGKALQDRSRLRPV